METEAEKALNLLIHDLRAPLSVAQGYLRLIRENRLPAVEDRERVLAQTMDALGRITKLCADASAFAASPEHDPAFSAVESTRSFVERVKHACNEAPAAVAFDVEDDHLTGSIRAARVDRVAEAIGTIVMAAHRAPRDQVAGVAVMSTDNSVRFLCGSDADRRALALDPPETFDPWRGGHGLALPLACRTVSTAGGRIWQVATARGAVGISLPQE
jgi:signal transduction histidine kinase